MKEKVHINDRSIESAGIPKDYKESIAELVWNGFDAGATRIDIEFDANEIEFVNQLVIRDNGAGIDYNNLDRTFGTLLDSIKKVSFQRSSYVHGQKGKGRFSFTTFARRATWHSVNNPEGQPLEFSITIFSRTKDEYEFSEAKHLPKDSPTGTEVVLTNLFGVTASSFTSSEFIEFMCQQFGWFLFLNRKNGFSIFINGEELNFSHIIAEYDVKAIILDDGEDTYSFDLTYIRWKTRIGDRYFYYFLNQKKRECAKLLTSFNNNAIDFHHSLFIESSFFNDFNVDEEDPGSRLFGKNQSHPVFRALVKDLNGFLEEKEKRFIRNEAASRLVREYQVLGVILPGQGNALDRARQEHLQAVLREIYSLEPKLFKGLKREQQKAMVGMLELLLESSERTRVLEVLNEIIPLTDGDRHKLQGLFEPDETYDTLQNLKLIQQRHDVVALLQHMSGNSQLFLSEKERIRELMAENCWLLDEAYHLTAPNSFSWNFLLESLTMLDGKKRAGSNGKEVQVIRPDIFVSRTRRVSDPDAGSFGREENLLIDLKRPDYVLSQEDHRQAQAYLRYIIKDPQYGGQEQVWKFYLVAEKVDRYIEDQYNSYKNKGKPFLIQAQRNYELYALTWKDLFNNFSQTHSYLLGKQSMERAELEHALLDKGIKL